MEFLKIGLFMMILLRMSMSLRSISDGSYKNFVWGGRDFAVAFRRSKRRIVGLCLRIDLEDKLSFVLRRESRFDKFAKSIGIANESQTGDQGFDDEVFIVSEDAVLGLALSADRELRDLCAELLAARSGAGIECKRGKLYYEFSINDLEDKTPENFGPKFSRELELLVKLRHGLQRVVAGQWQEQRDPALTRKAWLVGISVALGVAGLAALFMDWSDDHHQVVREMIPLVAASITAYVAAMLLFATFAWLKSTPHTHGVLLDVLLMAAPGCWATANAGTAYYNEKFDREPAQSLPIHIADVEKVKVKHGWRYYLYVEQWPDPRGARKVAIDESQYVLVHRGDCITVVWHRGRLGDGWVSGYERGCVDETGVEK